VWRPQRDKRFCIWKDRWCLESVCVIVLGGFLLAERPTCVLTPPTSLEMCLEKDLYESRPAQTWWQSNALADDQGRVAGMIVAWTVVVDDSAIRTDVPAASD
jgi:hypothetical protein